MAEGRLDIGSVFDIIQDIGETAGSLFQSFAGGSASGQLGLCQSEYIKAVEDGAPSVVLSEPPEYAGHPFNIVNGIVPSFSEEDKAVEIGCERHSALDGMERCGAAFALVSRETMPEDGESRRVIKQIVPTGTTRRARAAATIPCKTPWCTAAS